MTRSKLILAFALACMAFSAHAQKEYKDIRSGNKAYEDGKYTEAEIEYRKGLSKNSNSFESNFNIGNALYKQGKYKEAIEFYQKAGTIASKGEDKERLSNAFHNIGNSLYKQNEYEKSIEAYKNSLKLNPKSDDTRYNLSLAKAKLKKQ